MCFPNENKLRPTGLRQLNSGIWDQIKTPVEAERRNEITCEGRCTGNKMTPLYVPKRWMFLWSGWGPHLVEDSVQEAIFTSVKMQSNASLELGALQFAHWKPRTKYIYIYIYILNLLSNKFNRTMSWLTLLGGTGCHWRPLYAFKSTKNDFSNYMFRSTLKLCGEDWVASTPHAANKSWFIFHGSGSEGSASLWMVSFFFCTSYSPAFPFGIG